LKLEITQTRPGEFDNAAATAEKLEIAGAAALLKATGVEHIVKAHARGGEMQVIADLAALTTQLYTRRMERLTADVEALVKAHAAGQSIDKALFIGPRGGKWADAKHTIPWKREHEAHHRLDVHGGETPSVKARDEKGALLGVLFTEEAKGRDGLIVGWVQSNLPSHGVGYAMYQALLGETDRVLYPASVDGHDVAPSALRIWERLRQNYTAVGEGVRGRAAIDKALFIGPRGGKWADAKHTIPWKEEHGAHHHVEVRKNSGGIAPGAHKFRVVKHEDGHVQLSRHEEGHYGPKMPAESVKHFVNDLAGRVDLPKHGRADIDAVVTGKAKFLGKGDDGLAFKVGDKVVKVSTTVPFVPENPGHRTPEAAADMLRRQVEVGNHLASKGIAVQRSEYVRHGDKGFQIKPYVEIPEKLTRAQLDAAQEIVQAMHAEGYTLNDTVQVGLDKKGDVIMFDVGKAAQSRGKHDLQDDYSALHNLYYQHGEKFVRLGRTDGEIMLEKVDEQWDKWTGLQGGKKMPKLPASMLARYLGRALDKRAEELRATLKGKELADAIQDVHDSHTFKAMDVEDAFEAEGKEVPERWRGDISKAGPYIGPRGGKWADAKHTIPWKEDTHGKPHRKEQEAKFDGVQDVLRAADRSVLVLYQANDARTIHTSPEGGSEHGIFLSPNRRYASMYGSNVHKTWAKIGKPKIVEGKHEIHPGDLKKEHIDALKAQGYDSIIVVSHGQGVEHADEVVLFSGDQLIKHGDFNALQDVQYAAEDTRDGR
jgi:hypothetical protein